VTNTILRRIMTNIMQLSRNQSRLALLSNKATIMITDNKLMSMEFSSQNLAPNTKSPQETALFEPQCKMTKAQNLVQWHRLSHQLD
jgi:hypothetical protein